MSRKAELGFAVATGIIIGQGISWFLHLKGVSFLAADLLNFLGAVATTYSFALGTYFALLAVNAYAQARSIDDVHGKVNKIAEQIIGYALVVETTSKEVREGGGVFIRYLADVMDIFAGGMHNATGSESEARFANLYLVRARFGFKLEVEQKRKMVYARTLLSLTDGRDLPELIEFLENSNDPDAVGMLRIARRKKDGNGGMT